MRRGRGDFGSSDSGFSLPELTVVVVIMGFIIAAAWAGMYVISQSAQISGAQGDAAAAFADPMEQMSRIIMQNSTIKSCAPYRMEVWTDRNMDGLPELNAFYTTSDRKLVWEQWIYNTSRTSFTAHKTWVMDSNNANQQTATPLFRYFDKTGAELTGAAVGEKGPSDSVYVKATVVVRQRTGAITSDTRDIAFRNRS